MRLKFVLLGLIGLFSISSFAQKKPTKAELDASNVIRFGNTVIDLGNFYSNSLQNYDGVFSTAESNIQKLTENADMQPFAVNCKNLLDADNNLENAYKVEVKNPFSFTEKTEINSLVENAKADTKNIEKWCTKLSNYFSNKEEYTADADFKKAAILMDSLKANVYKAKLSWRVAADLASDAGNRAELVLLKGSQIADFVIPMKTDLNSLKKILGQLQTENPDASAIKQNITDLELSIKTNKDISNKDVSKLSDVYYKEVYQEFYTNCEACIDYLNNIVSDIESNKVDERTNDQLDYLGAKYGEVIGKYNTFVSQ